MSWSAALPNNLPEEAYSVLTFVVPAPNGCNLSCPYCYIDNRREQATSLEMLPEDYAEFIAEITAREDIRAICIQGYEPLLPETLPYTQAILSSGTKLGIPVKIESHLDSTENIRAKLRDISFINPRIHKENGRHFVKMYPKLPFGAEYAFRLIPKKMREDITGDLTEEYFEYILPAFGRKLARRWLYFQIACSAFNAIFDRS